MCYPNIMVITLDARKKLRKNYDFYKMYNGAQYLSMCPAPVDGDSEGRRSCYASIGRGRGRGRGLAYADLGTRRGRAAAPPADRAVRAAQVTPQASGAPSGRAVACRACGCALAAAQNYGEYCIFRISLKAGQSEGTRRETRQLFCTIFRTSARI